MKHGSDKGYLKENEKGWYKRRQADAIVSKLGKFYSISKVANFIHEIQNFFLKQKTTCISLKALYSKQKVLTNFLNKRKREKKMIQRHLGKHNFSKLCFSWKITGG
jgi:hypothetical protein